MNTRTFQIVLQLSLIVASFIAIAIFWDKRPPLVPTHWGMNGVPNDYMRKGIGILVLPGINLFSFILCFVLPYIDPKVKERAAASETGQTTRPYLGFITVSVVFLTGLFVWQLGFSLDWFNPSTTFVQFLIPIMFMAMGNLLGTLRPSYYIGIRTPWTLDSETVWVKTHRMAGYLWVASSATMLALMFVLPMHLYTPALLVYIGIIVVVPVAYSFLLFRKKQPQV